MVNQMGDEWPLGVGKPVGSEKNAAPDLFRDMGVEPALGKRISHAPPE